MKPRIYLRDARQTWWESATDEKGTLSISRIAEHANVLPATLLLGPNNLLAYDGITINEVKEIYGSTIGDTMELAVLVHGIGKPAAHPEADSVDRSEAWIKSMLLPERPELPTNKADLTKVLFPEPHQKLPVSKQIYQQVAARTPDLAAKVLVVADGSVLPSAMGVLLATHFKPVHTEMDTSIAVGFWLRQIFGLFEEFSEVRLKLEISSNSNERGQGSYSQTTEAGKRPDTIVIRMHLPCR